MTLSVNVNGAVVRPRIAANRRWLIVAILLATAFCVQYSLILNSDLGWLLTACEKILAGRKYGVDLFESNPPLSLFLYLPAVVLGRMLGVAPEIVVDALVLIEIAAALCLVDRGAAEVGASEEERDLSVWALAFLLAILAGKAFGQREHIAVIALTPFVAMTAFRWRGLRPGSSAIAAGLGGGLAMCVKPYFALVIGAPMLANALRSRSVKPLLVPEAVVAAVVVLVYAATVLWGFPAYVFDYVPMLDVAYLPVRKGLGELAIVPTVVLAASLVLMRLVAELESARWTRAIPWLAAAVGGGATYFVQGKGWTYTALALITFAMAAPLMQFRLTTMRAAPAIATSAVLGMIGFYLLSEPASFPVLTRHVEALVEQPRLLAITDDIGIGHPLVRQVHGTWVGDACAELLSGGAIWLERTSRPSPAEQAKLDKIVEFERRLLLGDLIEGRPDVVLADSLLFSQSKFDWLAWAEEDPAIRAELAHYRLADEVGRVRILVRQP